MQGINFGLVKGVHQPHQQQQQQVRHPKEQRDNKGGVVDDPNTTQERSNTDFGGF